MRRRRQFGTQKRKKRGKGIPYIHKSWIYSEKKTTDRFWCSFTYHCASTRKLWGCYWSLMVKRKYKIRKKNRRKYKKKCGKGFGDGFKFLYSLGKQRRKSMQ